MSNVLQLNVLQLKDVIKPRCHDLLLLTCCREYFAFMTTDETQLFALLDKYARSRHGCFPAEMNPDKNNTEYSLCFRPLAVRERSPDRYACRYVQLDIEEARSTGHARVLSSVIQGKARRARTAGGGWFRVSSPVRNVTSMRSLRTPLGSLP
jgi:hypothetical protein